MTFARPFGLDGAQLGCWCSLESPVLPEVVGRTEYDWICFDMQHGFGGWTDLRTLAYCLDGSDTELFVRVQWNDPWMIMKACDAGARGVIVPMVETALDIRAAVAACRYPPEGKRSFAGLGLGGGDPLEANRSILLGAMIETSAAHRNLAEILQVPGLDFIIVGPEDLSLSANVERGALEAGSEWSRMLEGIVDSCRAHGVVPGIYCGDVATTLYWRERGYRLLALATDRGLLNQAAVSIARASRAAETEER